MANVLGELFQNIADAIRSKTGSTDTLKPNQFPEAIEGITAGGGEGEKPFDCHSVTFVYGDKSYVRSVADGDTCADPVERGLIPTPTKESTAQYNYTFYGWGASDGGAADANILKNITEDKTVYAIFTATLQMYTITWLDSDGVTELPGQKQWAYGTVPSYTPTKGGYAFDKWTPTPTKVTGEASYTASWSSVLASGTCGDSAYWALSADYVLTISGNVSTYSYLKSSQGGNFSASTRPWEAYLTTIVEVVVKDGITYLGYGLFTRCTALKKATLADSVSGVGGGVFHGCTALTDVKLSNGLKIIGSNMFGLCTALQSITIPESVTKLSDWYAFIGCTKLASITIPRNVVYIANNTFKDCTALKTVTFEETSGWVAGSTELSETDLANPATAATYLTNTYKSSTWTRT